MLAHALLPLTPAGAGRQRLFFLVVDDVDLLAGPGKLQALADFDLLLLRIVLEAEYSLLFLFDFTMQALVAEFIFMHLPPLVEETGNTVGASQDHECIDDSA
jgi:hypothetical protein